MNIMFEYRKKGTVTMIPFIDGMEKTDFWIDVSVSVADKEAGSPMEGDMIAINPKNIDDKWLVAKAYFEEHYESC